MRLSCVFVFFGCKATETGKKIRLFFYPRLTRADALSGGKKLALDIVIVPGVRPTRRSRGFAQKCGKFSKIILTSRNRLAII